MLLLAIPNDLTSWRTSKPDGGAHSFAALITKEPTTIAHHLGIIGTKLGHGGARVVMATIAIYEVAITGNLYHPYYCNMI